MASQDLNFDETLKSLYAQYKERGYITEDQILDCAYSADVLSRLTERLLDLGVVIQEEPVKTDASKEEETYDASRIDYDDLFNKVVAEYPELKSFIKYVKQIKPPQFKEWQTLFPQAKSGNQWAEDRLFEMYLRVVVKTAWHYHKKYNMDLCEAIQEGATGLLSAIEKFDISEYNAFTTFIARPIANFITRNCDIPNYVLFDIPTYYKDNLFKIYDIIENHQCPECMCKPRKNECETLKDEIVAKLDCSLEEAKEYLNIFTEHEHEIFELPDENQVPAFDIYSQKQLEQVVRSILMNLSPKEQFVIRERYISEQQKTLEEVGDFIGVTRERVRQIEIQALNKLKHPTRARALRSFLDETAPSVANRLVNKEKIEPQEEPDNEEDSVENATKKTTSQWNAAKLKKLQKYLDQGLSISEIAIKMKTTKGSIAGKVTRMGLITKAKQDQLDKEERQLVGKIQRLVNKGLTIEKIIQAFNSKEFQKMQDTTYRNNILKNVDFTLLKREDKK